MPGVLEGLRVIDLAQGWAGPGASMYLGDQGADVLKVEPLGGDMARGWYPSPALHGTSRSFLAINRNKRGMAVDLAQPAGKQIFDNLIQKADVLIVNLRPGAAGRLGVDYHALSARHPRLIYAAVSGYGNRGPYATRPAFDAIVQGLAGAMYRTLPDGTPLRTALWVADCTAPMLLAYGITLALLARERTGRGQKVDTSLLQAAVAVQVVDLVQMDADPNPPGGSLLSSGVYRCGDARYINVAALTEKQVVALCTVLGLEHILQDASFLAEDRDITLIQRQWRTEMTGAFASKPAAAWLRLLTEADVPCGPVLSRAEVFDEPQVRDNDAIVPMHHPDAGAIKIAGIPVTLSDNPGDIRLPAPSLGQHTDEVLQHLGYSAEQIADLHARNVVA